MASCRFWEEEPGFHNLIRVVGVVGDFAADVAVVLVLFENLDVERDGLLRARERAHHFLHAGEDLCAAALPIGSGADFVAGAVGG